MIAIVIVAFVGWLIWVTSALSDNGRAINELRRQIGALQADEAEREAPAPLPTSQMELEFDKSLGEAPNDVDTVAAEAVEGWAESPAPDTEQAPEEVQEHEPHVPASLAWERAWQSLAGPLAFGRGASEDIGGAEARLGTVWLSRIGVVLLLIGAVFAYHYGVTTNLHRLIIGYAAGIGLLALGYWGQRRQYRIWAQAITGGGLGLLYLTTTAGSALFDPVIIPQTIGFALMALTTALGTGLAVYYNAQVVGLLSLIGGFATPFVLSTGGNGDVRLLFAYIAILDAGLLLVAYFRRWSFYNYLVFVATWGIFGLWRVFRAAPGDWQWAMVAATAFFAIFSLVSVAHCLIRRLRAGVAELLLAIVNGAVYFVLGLGLIDPGFALLHDAFAFAVAAVYLVLGALTVRRNRDDRLMLFAFIGQAVVYLTIGFPIALHGTWITTAWALEGALLVWLGFASGLTGVRQAGLAVLGLAAGRLALLDTFPARFGLAELVPGLRAFTFVTAIMAMYIAMIAYVRHRGARVARDGLAIAASFFTLWYLALEVFLRYRGLRPIEEAIGSCGFTIAAVWAVYGLLLALVDFRADRPGLRNGARVILCLSVAVMAASNVLRHVPVAMGYLGIGVTALAAWLAELSFRSRGADQRVNGGLSLATGAVTFAAVALQANRVLDGYLTLPAGQPWTPVIAEAQTSTRIFVILIALAVYSLVIMAAAVLLRSASARGLTCLFSVLLSAGAAYAARYLQADWQLRALAFALIVPGAYLTAWLSSTQGEHRPPWERPVALTAGLAAAALTAWWGAAELLRSPSGSLYFIDGPRFNLILIWLGGYGLALCAAGMRLRSIAVRSLATAIQWLALIFLLVVSALLTTPWATNISALGAIVLGVYVTNWLFRSRSTSRRESHSGLVLGMAACAGTLAWAATAIDRLFMHRSWPVTIPYEEVLSTRNHWFLIIAGLYALAVMAAGLMLRSRATRGLGFAIQGLAIAGVLTVGLRNLAAPSPLRLVAYAACIGGAYVAALAARRVAPRTGPGELRATELLSLAAAGLTVVWLAFQANILLAGGSTGDFGISASWGVYGLVVLVVGFISHHRLTRLLGLLVLALTLGKIGIFDMWQLAVNWRIWITVGLGVIFVTASLMYQRFARAILGDDLRSQRADDLRSQRADDLRSRRADDLRSRRGKAGM